MFVIRDAHEQAFGEAGLRRFNARAAGFVSRAYPGPASGFDPEELRLLFDVWCPDARRAGFKTEKQMVAYYVARLIFVVLGLWGPAFDLEPWLAPSASSTPTDRSEELLTVAKCVWDAREALPPAE